MKNKIIYIFLFAFLAITNINAQLNCTQFDDINLDENGNASIPFSDLVENLEFYLANGSLTYFMFPFNSGEITSGTDELAINCSNTGIQQYIIEYVEDGAVLSTCSGTINVFDPFDSCNSVQNCDNPDVGCEAAYFGVSFVTVPEEDVPAENFAICSSSADCSGEYKVAIGSISQATSLTYTEAIDKDDLVEYITPVVLSYTENGGTQFDQAFIYIWENIECLIVANSSTTVELSASGELLLTPDLFLESGNTCTDISMVLTGLNDPAPTPSDYAAELLADCDDLGYHRVYLRDGETGFIATSELFVSDPQEVCGPILGPGDRLIKMSNNPPVGTYAETTINLNGQPLPRATTTKGWIINDGILEEGTNTLEFSENINQLNGVSTLDLVFLLKLIIQDEYDSPIESVVMDIDQSGYNGINDLIILRQLILGEISGEEYASVLFKPGELEFPSDFNPFDFDYDFTKYEFEASDFDDLTFLFEGYKVGDFNGNAITESGLKEEEISSTRELDKFEVSEVMVEASVPFSFDLKYDTGTEIIGLLAALVSDGVRFQELTSMHGSSVEYHILNNTEIRISYIADDFDEPADHISFRITAVSDKSGKLIDLLGLKSGFPQEVINSSNEVIIIDELEESVVTSIKKLDSSVELTVYPNPTQDRLIIAQKSGILGTIEILDPMGKRVFQTNTESSSMNIDVSYFPSGLYYITVENGQRITQQTFVKK